MIKTCYKILFTVLIMAGLISFFSGFYMGKKEAAIPAKAAAEKSFKSEIDNLQKQIRRTTEDHNMRLVSLQREQASEINSLEQINASAIRSLERDQNLKINTLKNEHVNVINVRQSEHNQELLAERDTFYLKGQIDARDSIQNQIDERHNRNISNNDWNAPVYSIRRR